MAKRNQPTPVSKTALDSLHAKLSAIDAGWLHHDTNQIETSHPIHTYAHLLRQLNNGPKRRQAPLVNAGYAARMAVMSYILERWVDGIVGAWVQHSSLDDTDGMQSAGFLNVVMVGCGMDALGLWSKHLLLRSLGKFGADLNAQHDSLRVNVFELDSWDNCVLKTRSLMQSGLLVNVHTVDDLSDANDRKNKSYHIHAQGSINLDTRETSIQENDYTLISLDLREMEGNKSILSQVLLDVGLDSSQPSIVISELVLAYLGYESANAVMHSISDILSGNKLSMFTCLEPMFLTHDDVTNISPNDFVSVQQAYARDYSRQFLSKLSTGDSDAKDKAEESSLLHPLGSNKQNILIRLESCGLSNSHCTTLQECTAEIARILRGTKKPPVPTSVEIIGSKFLCTKEPFDEHAALSLNLNCYCVICSFNLSYEMCGENKELNSLIKTVCPWETIISIKPISTTSEDAQVNDLYGKIYVHLYNEFPAIQKMVKSALKGDLSTINASGESVSNSSSVIRDKFIREEGDFWIATIDNQHDEAKEQSVPIVVGCIGIKRRSNKSESCSTDTIPHTEYEIHRFAVDDSYRGFGIGKKLLQVAELSTQSKGACELYAVTPSCLLAANKLYESNQYCLDNTKGFMAGRLQMNVYSKSIGAQESKFSTEHNNH